MRAGDMEGMPRLVGEGERANMSGEIVGYATKPREGRPSRYCGRTMRWPINPATGQRFVDEGLGNPFRLAQEDYGRKSTDPVRDFTRLLQGDERTIWRAGWTVQKWEAWIESLPRLLVGRDLLCWCRKPGTPSETTIRFICHADVLLAWVHEWEWAHADEAAAIRRELFTSVS